MISLLGREQYYALGKYLTIKSRKREEIPINRF